MQARFIIVRNRGRVLALLSRDQRNPQSLRVLPMQAMPSASVRRSLLASPRQRKSLLLSILSGRRGSVISRRSVGSRMNSSVLRRHSWPLSSKSSRFAV